MTPKNWFTLLRRTVTKKLMTILVLEDDNTRFAHIRNALPGQHVVRAEKAKEAIRLLQDQEFEFIMLDHDLCDEHYEQYQIKAFGGMAMVSREANGMRVVDYLVENPHPAKVVIVHSLNDIEAPEMVLRLMEGGYPATWSPKCWLRYSSIVDEVIAPLIK